MAKSIKFKDEHYLNASSIDYKKELLSDILDNLLYGTNQKTYNPVDVSKMTSENYSEIIDVSRTNIFTTSWRDYASYDSRFCGVLGIYIKGSVNSTGGIAIIFSYSGGIGFNIRIDNNRWGGWKWL